MSDTTRVIVIGGGYAGVMAANRLTQRDDVAVTLINARSSFVERIRLHQLAAGTHAAAVDYRTVLAERVELVVDAATGIDTGRRSVALAGGGVRDYDYLIYAVGSRSAGGPEHAYPIATWDDAQRLRHALEAAPGDAPVTVVGGGATGLETAAELAEAGRSVTLVCSGVVNPYLHERGRREVTAQLAALGVRVVQGVAVTAVGPAAVRLADGRSLESAVTVWTAGFSVPDLAARSGLSVDGLGRLRTDETLTSIDDDRVVAAGDCAAPSDRPFRMSCQAAGPLGMHAAATVLRRIAGDAPEPLAIGFVGQCLSVGRRAGLVQFAHRDDRARRFVVGGRMGARIKEFVCWGTVKQLSMEARKPGAMRIPGWTTDGSRRSSIALGRSAGDS
ncbi:NADH dehydrogenase FAD-containing subunit [Actinoplanes lutulentus]|uniref:NADH dehydrogenase FAD-containing subunit n=1 Tax=Actinoplanes lutulentus TaxID=1287878 RepID=A0A327Z4U3_9ACTN|nr:FAD-dependent oxidoreductase [Actinoplanes lutulentus]MBB2948169.1 NADH dehydrogenase FAD-containing subunit [Actinoplanes lutulentus]RAK31331.1 NADH dehydrogenase FAD-containing subunit [Actinoplanes lutulentus]